MASNLQELIQERYGIARLSMNIDPMLTQLTTSADIVAQVNPARVSLYVVNLSANDVYLLPGTGGTVSSTHGFGLAANGGTLFVEWRDDGILCGQSWQGIASGAGSNILTVEMVIDAPSDLEA